MVCWMMITSPYLNHVNLSSKVSCGIHLWAISQSAQKVIWYYCLLFSHELHKDNVWPENCDWFITEKSKCLWYRYKLDETMARRHMKSPLSLSGRSLHLPQLDHKMSRPWWRMNPLCSMSIGPAIPGIRLFQYLTLKIQGQGHVHGQTQWLHLMPKILSICLVFISWQYDYFWLWYSKFHICP